MSKVIIGCDNAAIELKTTLIEFLTEAGYEVKDVGCYEAQDNTYYPLVAKKLCDSIIESGYKDTGVLICGTGIGMAMAANKFKGIRAAVCHDIFSAERAKLSNDANVICMGERVIGKELAKRLIARFMELHFIDGPSTGKVQAIRTIEAQNMKEG